MCRLRANFKCFSIFFLIERRRFTLNYLRRLLSLRFGVHLIVNWLIRY